MELITLASVTPLRSVYGKTFWTDRDIEVLTILYPFTPTRLLADAFKVSEYQIAIKAQDLNLQKDPSAKARYYESEIIKLFPNFSLREIAEMLNVSLTFVTGICKAHSLTKSDEAVSEIKRRKRNNLLKRERARVIWGFPALSKVPVLVHHQKAKVRNGLLNAGYIVQRGKSEVFYNANTNRSKRREDFAEKLGFTFYPVDGCDMEISI